MKEMESSQTTSSSRSNQADTSTPEPLPYRAVQSPTTVWHPEVERFRDHIHHELEEHAHKGVNGRGEDVPFVCRDALRDYWTRDNITAVLDRDRNAQAHAEVIETACLETFSILCYINCSAYFNHLTLTLRISDSLLPIVPPSYSDGPWSSDPGLCDALARFRQAQWMFKPLCFDTAIHRKDLTADYILPVVYDKTPLGIHNESAVYKVSVQPCCVAPRFERFAKSQDVVFKMLTSEESELWENEVDAYNFLARSASEGAEVGTLLATMLPFRHQRVVLQLHCQMPGLLQAHAATGVPSPNQNASPPAEMDAIKRDTVEKAHVIMLEYARGGNLATFCQRYTHLVVSPKREDRLNLWHQMFHLLQALAAIHNIDG